MNGRLPWDKPHLRLGQRVRMMGSSEGTIVERLGYDSAFRPGAWCWRVQRDHGGAFNYFEHELVGLDSPAPAMVNGVPDHNK